MPRTMTPSMVELPKYSGSWGTIDSQESAGGRDNGGSNEKSEGGKIGGMASTVREKELPALPQEAREGGAKTNNYYDDASDEEEAREATATKVRYVSVARTSSKRIEYNRKMS